MVCRGVLLNKFIDYIPYLILITAQFALIATNQFAHAMVIFLCFLTFFIYQPVIFRNIPSLTSLPGSVQILLFIAFMTVQILPLPPEWISFISPASTKIYTETVWHIDSSIWMPVSIDTRSTVQSIFRMLAFFVFYLLASQLSVYKSKSGLIWISVISAMLFWVGISTPKIGSSFTINGVLIGQRFIDYIFQLKDSAIAVILVVSPLVYAAFMISNQKAINLQSRKTRHFFSRAVFAVAICVVLVSGSLMIWVAAFISLVSWGAIFGIRRRVRGRTLQLACLNVVIILAGLYMCSSGLSSHLFWNWDKPIHINPKTLETGLPMTMGGNVTIAGTGADTFDKALFFLESAEVSSRPKPSKAWQVITEAGLVGTTLIIWFGITLFRRTSVIWKKQRNKTAIYTFAGAFASIQTYLFLVTAAPYTRYNIPILYLALMLSFIISASKSSRVDLSASIETERSKRGWGGPTLLLTFFIFWGGEFYAETILPLEAAEEININQNSVAGMGIDSDSDLAELAVKFAPLSYGHRQALIDAYYAKGSNAEALRHGLLLLRLNPLSEQALLSTAMIYNTTNDSEMAELLMQASLKAKVETDNNNIKRINRLLSRRLPKQAVRYSYYSLSNYPEKTGEYLALLDLYDISEEEKRMSIPEKSYAYWIYAKRLLAQKNNILADKYFIDATRLASKEVHPDPLIYLTAIDYLESDNRLNSALAIALQGQEVFPHKADFTFLAASFYERTGVKYRAVEEYRKTLLLDPGDRLSEAKLDLLQNR